MAISELPYTDDSDVALILRTRAGDTEAYGLLHQRHAGSARALAWQMSRSASDADDLVSEGFARVLAAIQRGSGPVSAFRPYLLSTVRRLAYDRTKRERRETPVEYDLDEGAPVSDPVVDGFERDAAAAAFASLPERWRLVLWHTEVEGESPAQVAPLLGMSPNAVAALAYRAREGLRQAYLTHHAGGGGHHQECRHIEDRLAGYVRDSLTPAQADRVAQHLGWCEECSAAYLELLNVNTSMRSVIAAIVLGPAAVGYVASRPGAAGTGAVHSLRRRLARRSRHHASRLRHAVVAGGATLGMVVAVALVVSAWSSSGSPEAAGTTGPRPSVAVDHPDLGPRPAGARGSTTTTAPSPTAADGTAPTAPTAPERSPADSGRSSRPSDPRPGVGPAATSAPTAPAVAPATPAVPVPPPATGPPTTPATSPTPAPGPSTPSTPSTSAPASSAPPTTGPSVAIPPFGGVPADPPGPRPIGGGPTIPVAPTTSTTTTSTTTTTTSTTPTSTSTTSVPETTTPTTTATTTTTTTPPGPPSELAVDISSAGNLIAGRPGVVVAQITDRGAGPAHDVVAEIDLGALTPRGLPRGTSGPPSESGWTCAEATATALRCRTAALDPGASRTLYLPVRVPAGLGAASVHATVSGLADVAGGEADVTASLPVRTSGMAARFATVEHGDVLAAGNGLLTCPDTSVGCLEARQGQGDRLDNGDHRMVAVDTDADPSTSNSSSATIACAGTEVMDAALYWGADLTAGSHGDDPDDPGAVGRAVVVTPAGTRVEVEAERVDRVGSRYQAVVDATDLVRAGGAGTWTVGGVQLATGTGTYGGWSLVVACEQAGAPLRSLVVLDGLSEVSNGSSVALDVGGFSVPATGSTAATVTAVSYEGDAGLEGDQLSVAGRAVADALNPLGNSFNSTVSSLGVAVSGGSPADADLFGFDLDRFDLSGALAAGATSTVLELDTDNDVYLPGVVAFTVDQ